MPMDDVKLVLARLDRVERQCRRWRRVTPVILMAVTLTAFGGAANRGVPAVVEAGRFVVRDGKDNVRMSWGYDPVEDRQELFFYAPGLKPRLGLVVYSGLDEASGLRMFDLAGVGCIEMGLAAKHVTLAKVRGGATGSVASLGVGANGHGGLAIANDDQSGRISLGPEASGRLIFSISDKNGVARVGLTKRANGKSGLMMRSEPKGLPFHSTH